MIHLHAHSAYSLLDGMGTPEAMVERAKEIGAPALAITDHASISGLTDFLRAAEKHGVKAIPGCEFYWVDDASVMEKGERRYHLTVWAKNWDGVLSIMRALTVANKQFYHRPRLSWHQVLELGPNVIIGTGCGFGLLSRDDWAEKYARLVAVYGPQSVYLEIMGHDIPDQKIVNQRAISLASVAEGRRLVATTDAHYVRAEDAKPHEVMLAIQTGATWDDPKRFRYEMDYLYLQTKEEVEALFAKLGYIDPLTVAHAIDGARHIANLVDVKMPKFAVNLPSPVAGDDAGQDAALAELLVAGWKAKTAGGIIPEDNRVAYLNRMTYELEVIRRLGFIRYFLVVEDIIRTARSKGIMVGPARGSAAGSLVCYLLGITQVDPLKFGLFFERFLNPERIDLPDIDVDFADDRREEVFAYIREKYGAEYTANINTYGTLSPKSAFRDVCRVFAIDTMKVNILSKQIEDMESFDKVPDLINFAKGHREIVGHVKHLDGVIRNNGVHACGMLVSNKKISDVSVIERRKDGIEVVNWDMRQAETFGLVKIDILGLTTLTILNAAKRLIKERRGIDLEYTAIPLDDATTLEAFARGETMGVFQFEHAGMTGLLRALGGKNFDMLADCTALFRPGSLNSGQTEMYVKIHKGDEYESYACEQLKPILGATKGILVYQEQIMQIFNQLGGFSWAEADKMRKIIGKKLGKDEFEKHRKHFVDGCIGNGIDGGVASSLFDKMAEFAAYSFNKSHAVAYTFISFWTMYTKIHFPLEYCAALLTYSPDASLQVYATEAARLGVAVLPPDINLSGDTYAIADDHTLVAPLGSIKGVGTKAVEAIIAARANGEIAAFHNPEDLYNRVNRRVVNVRIMDLLKRGGAFASLGISETDPEKRAKDYAELLPFYSSLPTITGGGKLDKAAIQTFVSKCQGCAVANKKMFIAPKAFSLSPVVMVINNPVKGEAAHFVNDGSKFFVDAIKGLGVDLKNFYYSSPIKCMFFKQADVPKDCAGKCIEHLREEIAIVKPKLILCFASNAMKLFGVEEQMGKHHGTVVYNKTFDCYILYSFSPQYAYYSEAKTKEFFDAMNKLKEILG